MGTLWCVLHTKKLNLRGHRGDLRVHSRVHFYEHFRERLRGPTAILFISRDTCSDSIAKLFRTCFCVVSHDYRAIRCKMGYRTDVSV